MTKGEAMLAVCRAYGVEYAFSSPGSEWPPLWDALARTEAEGTSPRFINSRHESVALGVATGYHRQTGRLPLVLLHTGVGTAHTAMELRAARYEQTPLVVMAGESNAFGEWPDRDPGAQFFRSLSDVGGPATLAAPFVKQALRVASEPVLLGMVADACRLALTPPQGPVFVAVPMELMLGGDSVRLPRVFAPPPAATQAAPADLERVAELLVGAERPMILTESAGRDPTNVARLVALAETLGIPVFEASSPVYMNFPRNHPLHQGYDWRDARPTLDEADVVLLVACAFPWYPASARPEQATVISIDPEPAHQERPYWGMGVDMSLTGALPPALDGLLAAVRDRLRPEHRERAAARLAHWQEAHARQRAAWTAAARAAADRQPIDPRWAGHALGETLPADAILCDELITERASVVRGVACTEPGTWQSRSTGGLGVSMSTALGLKFAARDRLVVNVIGDGSFNYNPVFTAFGFVQQWDTPILVVLFNNGSYASMKNAHQHYYPEGWAVRTGIFPGTEIAPAPDYVRFAQSFDAHAERVTEPGALHDALTRAVDRVRAGQLALVEIVTAPVDPRREG
jgi:acetolactate synthase-1/2/3 large subunit